MPSAHSLESFTAELTRLTSSFRKNLSHLKSLGAKLVPLIFVLAWLALVFYAVCNLCRWGK